jgi:hypothetical protein
MRKKDTKRQKLAFKVEKHTNNNQHRVSRAFAQKEKLTVLY